MATTININGLTLCHRGSNGVSHNTLPDVCKTPDKGIPLPYENEAYSRNLVKGTTSVFADGGNMIANYGSQFATSILDEGGSMGGILSGTNMAETDWITHSFNVYFEGKPACRLTDKLFMNHRNTVNMSGLCQNDLSEADLIKELCKMACECWNKHKQSGPEPLGKGQQFQGCLNKKIEEKYYDGRYPKDDCPVWREVPFDRNSDWDMIDSKSQPGKPTGNYIRPDSRRLDAITRSDGKMGKLYDVKFPGDPSGDGNMDNKRLREYRKIAKKMTGSEDNYVEFNVADQCDDCGDPDLKKKRKEKEKKAEQTAPSDSKPAERTSEIPWKTVGEVVLGGLFVVGLACGVSEVLAGAGGAAALFGVLSTQ